MGVGVEYTIYRHANVNRRYRWLAWLLVGLAGLSLLAACADQDSDGSPSATATGVAPTDTTPATATRPVATPPPTPVPPTPTPPAPLAATVNGRYVFLADYEHRVAQYEEALLAQGLDPSSEDGKARLAAVRQEVLDSLVNYALIDIKAAELNVTLTDAEIEAQVEADIQAGGGQTAFDDWLKATGQTRDDYQASLREALLWQRVMDVITADIPATAEQVHLRHIIVDSQESADLVLAQLQAGADMAQLAREASLDVATRDNGGDLGWFPRGLLEPELETLAFSMEPGELAGPIDFGQGYQFVQLLEREAERALTPEMQSDLERATFERWLEEQRAAAKIEQFVELP